MLFRVNYFLILSVAFTLLYPSAKAQQSILLNQSSYNLFVLNPAAIGLNNELSANCHYKKNWLGLSESPELMQFTLDGPLAKKKYALGLNLANEKAGVFSKTYFTGAFRYKVKLKKDHNLLFGLSAGFQRQLSDFSKIKADAPDEFTQWPQQQAVTIPDASFGLVYVFKKLLVTASANQLLQQNYAYKEPVYNKELSYKTVSQFVLSIQNTFVLKPDLWSYTPQLTLRTPQGLPIQLDIVNTLQYKNKLLMGLGYRKDYALYANLGYNITEKLRVIYSYEYSLGIQTLVKGGHEIGLRFGLSTKKNNTSSENENISKRSIDEIFEKLDKHDQEIEVLNRKVDSLDKNISHLKDELELLKSRQVSQDELAKAIDSYFKTNETKFQEKSGSGPVNSEKNQTNKIDRSGKYKVISPRNEKDFETLSDSVDANYKIVLGVYQLPSFAKEYQKFLTRELNYESKLVQLNDHPKKFIYVCVQKEFNDLREALNELKKIRKNIRSKSVEITKGEAWILQTVNK